MTTLSPDTEKSGKRLSADVFCDATGKRWSAQIHQHPAKGGDGVLVWERHGMRSQRNAETAMEAAYQRLALKEPNP